jgi:hypothetical protein
MGMRKINNEKLIFYTVLQMLCYCGVKIKEDERDGQVARMEQIRNILGF